MTDKEEILKMLKDASDIHNKGCSNVLDECCADYEFFKIRKKIEAMKDGK